jgi:hypothetical protein
MDPDLVLLFHAVDHFLLLVCRDACMASLHTQKVLDLRQRWRYVVAHDARNQGMYPVRCFAPEER